MSGHVQGNGIFRDVYIIEQEENHIDDFLLRPEYNSDGTYNLKISVSGSFSDDTTIEISSEGLFEAVLKNLMKQK